MYSRKRTLRCFAVLLVALVCRGGCQADALTDAETLVLAADWTPARQVLQSHADPADPAIELVYAYACLSSSDYAKAADAFSRVEPNADRLVAYASQLADKHPGNATALLLKGDALSRAGKYDEALAALDEAVRLDARYALLYDVRGVVREMAFKHEEARADFEKALDLDPKLADALVNLGISATLDEDYVIASQYLDKAIELAPDFGLAYNARGVLNYRVRDWDAAERDFKKARELCPDLAFVSGNLSWLTWSRGNESFKAARAGEGDGRGTTLLASSVECHPVDLGSGRIVNVWEIKNTPLTATQEGMDSVYRYIRDEEFKGSGMPPDWKPEVLIAQHGMGGTAERSKLNFARTALSGGKDFVVYHDTSRDFRWTNPAAAVIPEDVTRRIERGVVAANRVYRKPADMLVESEASRLFGTPKAGSVTFSSLAKDGNLHPDFRVGTTVAYAVPFTDMGIDPALRSKCGAITSLSTDYNVAGVLPNAAFRDIPTVRLTLPDGGAPTHSELCRETWRKGIANPTWETAGLLFRGTDTKTVQNYVDSWKGEPRVYSTDIRATFTEIGTMASMTRSMITNPRSEGVLIACADQQLGQKLISAFDGYKAKWTPETDPVKLKQMAVSGGYSYVNRIGDPVRVSSPPMASFGNDMQSRNWTLPEVRSFNAKLDVVGELPGALNDFLKAGSVATPEWVGKGASIAAWLGPVAADLQSWRQSSLRPQNSKILEKSFDTVCEKLGAVPGVSDYLKAEALRIRRGAAPPSWQEMEYRVDSVCKPVIGMCVAALTDNPKAGLAAAKYAGFVRDALDAFWVEPIQTSSITRQFVTQYRDQCNMLGKRGYQLPTMTEYLNKTGVTDSIRFDRGQLAREDAKAIAWNAQNLTAKPFPGTGAGNLTADFRVPVITSPRAAQVWKTAFPGQFPPDKFGGAAVPDYRLPSTSLPGDKRGGVAMKADVVTGESADTSEMFGGESKTEMSSVPEQSGLVAAYLLFCSFPASGK